MFQSIQENLTQPGKNPYVEGHDALGLSMIERKREKEKDIVPIPFTGIAPNDLWKNTIPITSSIRSQKSIEASL